MTHPASSIGTMSQHVFREPTERTAALDRVINGASLVRFVAGLTLAAAVIGGVVLLTSTAENDFGQTRPFVGLGIAVIAIAVAVATLMWFVASWADTWRTIEEKRA